jgi:hypothetical protein
MEREGTLPPVFHKVLILKQVKVICFDTLLQVLILKSLYCTKIVQNGLFLVAVDSKGIRFQGCRREPKNEKRQPGCRTPEIRTISQHV